MAKLRDHLLRFYPADHLVHYIKTGSGIGARSVDPIVETLRLDDLDHPGRHVGSTLLVPRRALDTGNIKAAFDFERPSASFISDLPPDASTAV